MKATDVTIAWPPESPKAVLNCRLPPFVPSWEHPESRFCLCQNRQKRNQRHPPGLFQVKTAWLRTLLQCFVVHRNRPINEIVVLG